MSSMFRSRWAAVGAAVAVSLGAGGLGLVKAAPISSGDKPVFVAIEPCRLIDTRPGYPVGPFNSPIVAGGSITVTATGNSGDCTGIPTDVTSVALNVTALFATASTDLRIYPTGAALPNTSSLNPVPGQTVFNAVITDVAGGQFDIRNLAGEVHVIADLTGYYIDHNHDDRYYTEPEVDQLIADNPGPARVVWVADDGTGDYTTLSAALASITDNSASMPYVIKIAPGVYTEPSTVVLKNHVDVEGSGQDVTTITCACGSSSAPEAAAATVSAGNITAEIRHLTIANTATSNYSIGVYTSDVADGSMSLTNVTATAHGSAYSFGVVNDSSSPSMTNVAATGTGSTYGYGVLNYSSSPSMTNLAATATGGTASYGVFNNASSSPSIRGSSITGDTYSVFNNTSASAKVADTTLDGPVAAGAELTCVGVHNAAFVELSTTCT